jgi:TetR/AcrR family transcriptional regulator
LKAAEQMFAERGFRGTTLGAIARSAGLSRATPSYFFGSKDALYREVLESLYEAREHALEEAFAPVRAWASAAGPPESERRSLADALAASVAGYFAFFDARPSFARLVDWEALEGAGRLGETGGRSVAVSTSLRSLHAVHAERGLRDFDPVLVSVALVSMCFLPVAHAATFQTTSGIDTSDRRFRAVYQAEVVSAVLHLVGAN